MDRHITIRWWNLLLLGSFISAPVGNVMAAAPAIKPATTSQSKVTPTAPSVTSAPTTKATTTPQVMPAPAAQTAAPAMPAAKPVAPTPTSPVPTTPTTTPAAQSTSATQVAPAPVQPAPAAAASKPAAPAPVTAAQSVKMVTQPENVPPVVPKPPAPAEVPQAPQAPAPEEVSQTPSAAPEEFDTSKVKNYAGNWYLKRGWWENAESEYEKIREVLKNLFEARMGFFENRNEIERTLFEPFYRNMGFEQGELKDTLVYLIDQIEGARETEGTLDIKQREFLSVLEEEKKTLEQLKLDIDQFAKFDDAINDAIDLLMKEMNQALHYEQTAWKEFKAIADDLSDIKARERYYTIRTLYKDIKNIYEYVRGDFKQYFDGLAGTAHKEADRIKTAVQTLKSKGIDLKIEAKKLAEEPSKTAPAPTCGVKTEEPGYIMGAVYWVGGMFKSAWNLIFGWIYRF